MNEWTPTYNATAWKHGFAPIHRALGAVRVPQHEDICPRCTDHGIDTTEPDPTYCRGCLDEVSHAAEFRHIEGAWHQLGDDDTDGGRWVS